MIDVATKIVAGVKVPEFSKQVTFATAQSLTQVAKESQTADVSAIESAFTVRTGWDKPSNPFGVKVTPAKKDNLVAEVYTKAPWLDLQETGGTKTPQNKYIAIPTTNVRRTKRELVQAGQKPRALMNNKNVFFLDAKDGKRLICQRKGRGAKRQVVVLYILVPMATIKKQSTISEPTEAIVSKRFDPIFYGNLQAAFATAK